MLMGFKAVYRSASKFKYIVQTIARISDVAPISADDKGVHVRVLSGDKTTLISLDLPVDAFEEYECSEAYFIPVSSDELNKVVRRGTRNDMVEMLFESTERFLNVNLVDVKLNVKRSFKVPLRDIPEQKLPEPKLKLSVSMRMLTEDLKDLLRDVKVAGDEVEFSAFKEYVEAKCLTPQREYETTLRIDKPLISLAVEKPASATYAIDLLETALKATGASDVVTIEFGDQMPIRMTFELPTGGTLTYVVAPRVRG